MPDSPLNCMWVILKLLVGIEVLLVSLCVRVEVWTAVSVTCTGMTMIVVVMVMVGSSRLPLLGLIYMGTMGCMTMMAVPMSSSTGMAVVVVRLSCLLGLTFGGMMLMMLLPVTSATMVVVVVMIMIMMRFSGLSRLTWVYVVFSFAHLVGLVRGVLARTIGEIWGIISSGSVRAPL